MLYTVYNTYSYNLILFFVILSSLLGLVIYFSSYFISSQLGNYEKLTTYECGFDPFEDARNTFDIRFYRVGILFLIFDLEISFIFPWALVLNKLNMVGYTTMLLFLVILTLGFVYEWFKSALEWD